MRTCVSLIVVASSLASSAEAMLILGGTDKREYLTEGAQPGVAAVFNSPSRVAWWEGPPFGGGQYHAECRGDADAFNAVLRDFAKIEAKEKRLIVHDGVGASFWLNMNREPEKAEQAQIDWTFVAWRIDNWKRLQGMPAGLRPGDVDTDAKEPAVQIDVYVGGNIDWDGVIVPDGLVVDDRRLEANGFSEGDGCVVTGTVASARGGPEFKAVVLLQAPEKTADGDSKWSTQRETPVDDEGNWLLKGVPTGSYRLVAVASGHASRVVGYVSSDETPRLRKFSTRLVKEAFLTGKVVNSAGEPLPGAAIHLYSVTSDDGREYETVVGTRHKVGQDGTFRIAGLPMGWVDVRAYCPGHHGKKTVDVILPFSGLEFVLERAGQVDIEVSFANGRPKGGYLVEMKDAGGEKVGTWGGSGNIDGKDRLVWKDIPPGKYVVYGRPNPGSVNDQTDPQTIEIVGGETTFVTIEAK